MAAWRTLVREEIEKRSHHLTFRILLVTGENPVYSKSTCGPVDCVALSPPTAVSTPRMAVLHMAEPHTCSLLRSVHINWTPRTVAARSSVLARGSEDGTSMELESGEHVRSIGIGTSLTLTSQTHSESLTDRRVSYACLCMMWTVVGAHAVAVLVCTFL